MKTALYKFYSWGRSTLSISSKNYLNSKKFQHNSLAIGKSMSYGDCCLNQEGNIYQITDNKIISFDKNKGFITCQSGLTIADLHKITIPLGWMIPVSPGCENITIGGAVANDVHGKNFHRYASFGSHIDFLIILKSNGKKFFCSKTKNVTLFKATIGGIGLTGIILEIGFKLRKIDTILTDTYFKTFSDIRCYLPIAKEFDSKFEFSAAWVDLSNYSYGRGVVFGSNFSKQKYLPTQYKKKVLFKLPNLKINFINRITSILFSKIYYLRYKLSFAKYFQNTIFDVLYPLDSIENWNLIYGNKGFIQIQASCSKNNFVSFFNDISKKILSKTSSPLTVIKMLDKKKSFGMLSFPKTGHITIAIDIPNKDFSDKFFYEIESIVDKYNGRFYLAKDSFMSKNFFYKSYKRIPQFMKYKDKNLTSSMYKRLF